MTSRTLLLVAGPSGCGKSRLSRVATETGGVATLPLDEFYRDLDHPGLPRTLGIVDWDDVASWDLEMAIDTITQLLMEGAAEVPTYDISQSLRVGTRTLDMGDARVLLAEGIFAPPLLAAAHSAGLPVEALWLARHRSTNFSRRLARDLKERRKTPIVLVRRGLAIYRSEPQLAHEAMAAGFRAVGMREATRVIANLAGLQSPTRPNPFLRFPSRAGSSRRPSIHRRSFLTAALRERGDGFLSNPATKPSETPHG